MTYVWNVISDSVEIAMLIVTMYKTCPFCMQYSEMRQRGTCRDDTVTRMIMCCELDQVL